MSNFPKMESNSVIASSSDRTKYAIIEECRSEKFVWWKWREIIYQDTIQSSRFMLLYGEVMVYAA